MSSSRFSYFLDESTFDLRMLKRIWNTAVCELLLKTAARLSYLTVLLSITCSSSPHCLSLAVSRQAVFKVYDLVQLLVIHWDWEQSNAK